MKEKEKKESEKANAPFVDVGERFKIEKQKRKKCEGEVWCSSSADFSAIGFSSVQCWSSSVVLWPATVLLICIYIRIFTV